MGVDAIVIIGWRSDAGAYLVDSYPQGVEIDPQDLMNLFSLHRMGANNDLSKAVANFNFLRIEGYIMASWYSGFQSTKYIGRPNFCVSILIPAHENPNKWEDQLEIITYNILSSLESRNFGNVMAEIYDNLNAGLPIKPFEGFVRTEDALASAAPPTRAASPTAPRSAPAPAPKPADDFSDLLSLVDTGGDNSAGKSGTSDPFATGGDPFAATGAKSSDPFANDPFAKKSAVASAAPAAIGATPAKAGPVDPQAQSKAVIAELEKIDRGMPQRPNTDNADQMVKFLEKKVAFLESKIAILSKLVQNLQAKEMELNEKNDLIAKFLALLG
jgi:hypothetical protein